MRALAMRRIVGITYFTGELNDDFASYLAACGFDVLGMEGIAVPFADVGRLEPAHVRAFARDAFRRPERAAGVYLPGSGWRILDVIDPPEPELGVPVVHAVPAPVWAVQRGLGVPGLRPAARTPSR